MVVEQLARRGITDERVLAAFRATPRERFVPAAMSSEAYADRALPIECDQTISQPYMVACMTEALVLSPSTRVLEIGTGSGYQTAILARLVAEVFTVEWHLHLLNRAAQRIDRLGLKNVTFRCGDGSLGWAEHAPYDGVLVTAGAPEAPQALRDQLAEGGRLVIPVGGREEQTLSTIIRSGDKLTRHVGMRCRFVKLVGRQGWRGD